MTVRELYDYAISHSLLDHQVNDVLAIFNNKETSLNTPIQQSNLSNNDILKKLNGVLKMFYGYFQIKIEVILCV